MTSIEEIQQLQIVNYPHPTLRRTAKPIAKVDRELRAMIARMFDLMYEHQGIGLAANQVDLPFQVFVLNLEGDPERGEERVFINPTVDRPKGRSEAEEGCLSIPGVYGKVIRPERVRVRAFDLQGREIDELVEGLAARAIQHEFDHLQGVLFLDRMSETARKELEPELRGFELEFTDQRRAGHVGSDEIIDARLKALEQRYCSN